MKHSLCRLLLFLLAVGTKAQTKADEEAGAEASAGVLGRVGQARRARVGQDHGGRRGLCDRGDNVPARQGGLAGKPNGSWLVVVAQNTNAVLGLPPELQDIKTADSGAGRKP